MLSISNGSPRTNQGVGISGFNDLLIHTNISKINAKLPSQNITVPLLNDPFIETNKCKINVKPTSQSITVPLFE